MDSDAKDDSTPGTVATAKVPLPQSEAVANELQDLSLQPTQVLPPIQERKNILQLKLKQRRTLEELVSQGIMPPLKSPAAFHEQRRSLERARTEDYLKRKMRARPERAELVRMHILEETSAEPCLQAKQLQLKRARLADDLNDKISQRPGPMELVHKNILPVHSSLKQALIETDLSRVEGEHSSFDEDSSDALSPEQPANQDSPLGSATLASPAEELAHFNPSPVEVPPPPTPLPIISGSTTSQKLTNGTAALQRPPHGYAKAKAATAASSSSLSTSSSSSSQPQSRPKRPKEVKPKIRELKYHQYIPPDQKADRDGAGCGASQAPPPLDSAYAKILQQQQLFLQLQIISQQQQQQQQQQHYNYHTILPAPPKPLTEQQPNAAIITTFNTPSRKGSTNTSSTSNQSGTNRQIGQPAIGGKSGALPSNLEELKVAELKQELKLRSLPVSGTKTDLIERLKNYQELRGIPSTLVSSTTTSSPGDVPVGSGSVGGVSSSGSMLLQPHTQIQNCGSSPAVARASILHQTTADACGGVILAQFPLVNTVGGGEDVSIPAATQSQIGHDDSANSSPPLSPAPSEPSLARMSQEDTCFNGDTFGEMVNSPLTQFSLQTSPSHLQHHPQQALTVAKEESSLEGLTTCRFSKSRQPLQRPLVDKDRMLQEKDKQIEELRRKLLQKQHLVEALRQQLEMGKNGKGGVAENPQMLLLSPPPEGGVQVKEEPPDVPACSCLSPMEVVCVIVKEEQTEQEEKQVEVNTSEEREESSVNLNCNGNLPGKVHAQQQQQQHHKEKPTVHLQPEVVQAQLELLRLQQVQKLKLKQLQIAQQQQRLVLQHNQTNLQRKAQQRKRKPQKVQTSLIQQPAQQPMEQWQNTQLSTQQISQMFINQQPVSTTSFPLDLVNNHPTPTLVKDSNGNHFLITLANHSLESQMNGVKEDKPAKEITLQRLQSLPSKVSRKSTPQNCSTTSQSDRVVNQQTRKGLKTTLQVPTNQVSAATMTSPDPANLQAVFSSAEPALSSSQPSPSQPTLKEKLSGQRIDDLFDILMQSGDISGNFKPDPDPALARLKEESPSPSSADPSQILVCPSTPQTPDTTLQLSNTLCSDVENTATSPEHCHSTVFTGDWHLEDFLDTSSNVGCPFVLLDELQNHMLSTSSGLDGPDAHRAPSPMDTFELGYSAPTTGLDFTDAALDSMDWLDITMAEHTEEDDGVGNSDSKSEREASPTHGTTLGAPAGPPVPTSIFSADFLDSSDLQLHWDACL